MLRLAADAMATRIELVLADRADAAGLRAAGEAALAEVFDAEQRLSAFRPSSLLSHVNRRAHQGWVAVDQDTYELLATCAEVWRRSAGCFDPTVAPLMRELGLHAPRGHDGPAVGSPPIGMDGVMLDPQRGAVCFRHPGLQLDLGGIGKGHGLDLARDLLTAHGVRSGLLHAGTSTAIAIGAPPGGAGWRVQLGTAADAPCVELADRALSVSAPHGRRNDAGAGHILDPRQRASAAHGVALAAVVADRATTADAWSTALVAGAALDQLPRDADGAIARADASGGLHWQFTAPSLFTRSLAS